MNKELLAQDSDKMNAAGPQPSRAGTGKPVPEDALILIPMRNTVLFPGVITPVTVGRPSAIGSATASRLPVPRTIAGTRW